MSQLYFFLEYLKEISREEKPLNSYLSVQEDLFLDVKISYIKVNKVRGHLLSTLY